MSAHDNQKSNSVQKAGSKSASSSEFQTDETVAESSTPAVRSSSDEHLDETLEASDGKASAGDPVGHHATSRIDQYEIVQEIARGGMGVVFRARHQELDRQVALKMMIAGPYASEDEKRRFRVEAEAAAQLDHPNIVPVYDVGEYDGQPYFTMGYIEGRSLAAEIQQAPTEPRLAAKWCRQIAEAVGYAHEKGVIHRDIKPLNILIDQDQRPKITDFGLARRTNCDSDLTGTGQILGTPNFMAPEQAAGKTNQIGELSDVYAMGATLYCALTGRPPFQAATAMETLRAVLERDPVSPCELNSGIPVDLATICMKCLHKEPRARYESAVELSADLGRFLNNEPIRARPVGNLERAVKWARRRPAVSSLLAAVVTSLVALIVGGIWYQLRLAEALAESQARGAENARLLYDSAIREATFLNQVRPPGYTARVWEALHQIRHLETPDKDLHRIRQLGITALGRFGADSPDVFPNLGANVKCADVTWDDRYLITGLEDGRVVILDRERKQARQELQLADQPIAGVRMIDAGTFVAYTQFCRQIDWWKRSVDGTWALEESRKFEDRDQYYPLKPNAEATRVVGLYPLSESQVEEAKWNWADQKPHYIMRESASGVHFYAQSIARDESVGANSHSNLKVIKGTYSATIFAVSAEHLVSFRTINEPYQTFLQIVNLESGELERTIQTDSGQPGELIISTDGRFIAFGGHLGVEIFDRASGERIVKLDYEGLCWPISFVGSEDDLFYTDGDNYILYSLRQKGEVARYAKDVSIGTMRVSSSGRQLLWLGNDTGRVVDLFGRERLEFDFKADSAVPSFSRDGRLLIVNTDPGEVILIDTHQGREIIRLPGVAATISPDGDILMIWNEGKLNFWNTADGSLASEAPHEVRPRQALFDSSGKFIAISHATGYDVWEFNASFGADTPQPSSEITAHKVWSDGNGTYPTMSWSPDSPQLAYHKKDWSKSVIRVKDFRETGEAYQLTEIDPANPNKIAFLPHDRILLLDQFKLQNWDLKSREYTESETDVRYPIFASTDGRFVMARNRIHNVEDPSQFIEFPQFDGLVFYGAWSPDQRMVACAQANGKTIVWKLDAVGERLADLDLEFPVNQFDSPPPLDSITRLIQCCRSLPDGKSEVRWSERFQRVAILIQPPGELDSLEIQEHLLWLIDHLPRADRPFDRGRQLADAIRRVNHLVQQTLGRVDSGVCGEVLDRLIRNNHSTNTPVVFSAVAEAYHSLGDVYQYRSSDKLDDALIAYATSIQRIGELEVNGHANMVPAAQAFWSHRNYSEALHRNGDLESAVDQMKQAVDLIANHDSLVDDHFAPQCFKSLIEWLVELERFDEAKEVLRQGQGFDFELTAPR